MAKARILAAKCCIQLQQTLWASVEDLAQKDHVYGYYHFPWS
jgi:hypothetical protein